MHDDYHRRYLAPNGCLRHGIRYPEGLCDGCNLISTAFAVTFSAADGS